MKIAIGLTAAIVLTTGVAFARLMMLPDSVRPRLALQDAYVCAANALGSDTNQFYCVRANTQIMSSPDGDWELLFCSTNKVYKTVIVFYNKTVLIKNGRIWVNT
jgi:hypothetical protein